MVTLCFDFARVVCVCDVIMGAWFALLFDCWRSLLVWRSFYIGKEMIEKWWVPTTCWFHGTWFRVKIRDQTKYNGGSVLTPSSSTRLGYGYLGCVSTISLLWAQVEWWLEHRHGWLVKRQWGSILGWVSYDEYQVLGSTSIPARLDTLVYWESFSWLTSVGTTRNTVIRLGWSRIGLTVLILHAAGVGLTDRPAVISGRYNKYHSLQLQNYYAHFPPLKHIHIHASTTMRNWSWEWSWVSRHCMLAVAGGILCDRVKRPIGH